MNDDLRRLLASLNNLAGISQHLADALLALGESLETLERRQRRDYDVAGQPFGNTVEGRALWLCFGQWTTLN